MEKLKSLNFKIISLILGLILISSLLVNYSQISGQKVTESLSAKSDSVTLAEAKNIYSLFECPCCEKPIAECSCPMAKERMAFIDGVTAAETSEDEAILTYVKKYGLASFIEDEKKEEFRLKLAEDAPENRPIISLSTEVYNFGDVSQKEGIAETSFEIKNNGKTDLIINKIETSCGCTSASVVYRGKEGPKFNMPGHGINEEIGDWQVSIAPNETAQLKVYYDPNMHMEFRGPATRTVSVYSSDPIDFQKDVQIELNQVD